jgi:hypothetical protein
MAGPVVNKRESGFTIVELLVAGTLFLLLSLALMQIMLHAEKMTEVMITQTIKNSQARALFDLLAYGGVDPDATNTPVPGYHGSVIAAEPSIIPSNLQLTLGGKLTTQQTLVGVNGLSITCTAVGDRLKSCLSISPPVITVNGFIDEFNPVITERQTSGQSGRTVEVDFTVIDPHKVPRDNQETTYTQDEYSEKFWTIFTMNVD